MPPAVDGNSHLSLDALETAVRGADPCAFLVPAWLLQKLIASERGPAVNVFSLPRVQAHVIDRGRLMEIVQREELPLEAAPPSCATIVLLARPETDLLATVSGSDLLLRYWRLLFHARVKGEVSATLAAAPLPRAAVQGRIERLGRPAFNEARFVLQRERYVSPTADDCETYAEFAAFYLEFTRFAPELLAWFFPAISDPAAVLELLAADVDADAILKSTRPAGAAEPRHEAAAVNPSPPVTGKPKRRQSRDAGRREGLLAKAVAADAVGNDVRGALLRMRVYRASGVAGSARDNLSAVYADALKDLDQLTARLKAALQLDDSLARQWRAWLVALLENAANGWWNAEGRLLYDLQKVCVYHEREIYSVNVMDYVIDLGRRPLRRPQPGQRLVLTLKSLRSALRRTARARISPRGRSELRRLLRTAIEDAEVRLRAFLCPGVASALKDGGLHPATATETVAHAKLTEELLDEIVDNGYLTFPALRDAVSRNEMKLNDLSSRADYTRGDQLLQIDRKLEDNLDYVYRRGEIYLRAFHRLSSLFFATRGGRFLTRFLILPFGGAFLVLEFLDHSVGLLLHKFMYPPEFDPVTGKAIHHAIFNRWWLLVLFGLFLFGLIHAPPFRRAIANGLRRFFHGVRVVFYEAPRWLLTRPVVQAVLNSQFARLFFRYIFKPLAFAAFVYVFLPSTVSDSKKMLTLGAVFLVVNILLNSAAGRALEQAVLHTLRTTLARFTWEVMVTIVRGVVQIFQGLLEAVDRLLYAVDELLRFRAGQKRSTVVVKAALGFFWFYVAYITRFVINLLIEPQINPIKHFPVVTVSHKMILPTTPYIAEALRRVGIESSRAWAAAGIITLCTPGVFGFLAWEFKENWKLYRANRSKNLKAVRVGSHGEALATFLRPGLHSGTVPKIFHKLRKVQLRSDAPLAATNKHLDAAHHVEAALVAFFTREFLAQLNRHPLFRQTPVSLGHVHLATTLIRVEFNLGSGETGLTTPMVLAFEQRAAWILGRIEQPGWITDLAEPQSRQLAAALLGLYKLSGVDLIHEQVESLLSEGARFDFRRNDLIVWPAADFAAEVTYDLTTTDGPLVPYYVTAAPDIRLPALEVAQVLFRQVAVPRSAWIELWESDAADVSLSAIQVLPRLQGGFSGPRHHRTGPVSTPVFP
jgi:hypothetical protein